MRLNTLRARVVTWYVGLLAAALIVFGATLYNGVRSYLKASMMRTLSRDAKAIGVNYMVFEENKSTAWLAREMNEAYAPELSGRFIRITRQDGTVIYQSGDTRDPVIDSSEVARQPFTPHDDGYFRREVQAGSHHLMFYTQPFKSPSGTHYLIETGASLVGNEHVLASLLRIVLITTPLIILVAAFGGRMLMKLPLQPLVELTNRAELIGNTKLGQRLPVIATGDEMESLSLSLNRMISRLEEALSLNRRFSADVSHELRTPLTIMRGELEQVMQEPSLQPSVRESVGSSLEEITRMSRIVESLLAITRLDSGADAINLQPADIGKLCSWVMDQMRLLADEKNITMRVEATPVIALVDTERIKQVFVNLIDNAIKYTSEGGSITLKAFSAEDMAVIEVKDTGIGIPADELPHIFDRFFRADKARSRVSGGTGIGLSIAKAICNAHRGNISVRSTEGQGTLFRIELPLAAQASVNTVDSANSTTSVLRKSVTN